MRTYCLACRKHTNKVFRNKNIIKKWPVSNIIKANMLTYCLKCRKNTNKDAKMVKNKNGRLALSSKCPVCGSKKSRFMKKPEAGLLSNLGIKTPLSKIPLLGDLLF